MHPSKVIPKNDSFACINIFMSYRTFQINLPEKNTISDMDLCIIFANAIENAINASKLITNTNDRTLQILCKTKGDKLLIQITNSY
jgi:two-component system, LytTR family, sensor histidine kinase AgrC